MQRGKWASKREAVLISEYKLMDRKEDKLQKGIDKDSKVIERQRRKTGYVEETVENLQPGYYKRYVQQKPGLGIKQVTFANAGSPSQRNLGYKKSNSAAKQKSSVRSLISPTGIQPHDQEFSPIMSSTRTRMTYQNCGSYPNTNDYVKRILEGNIRDSDSNRHAIARFDNPQNGNKSHDRQRISIDDDSVGRSLNTDTYGYKSKTVRGQSRGEKAGVRSSAKRTYSKRMSENRDKVSQDYSDQNYHSAKDTDEDAESPRCLDLAEYLSEENHEWQEFQSNRSHGNQFVTFGKPVPQFAGERSPETQNYEPEERSTYVHAKQMSFENSMRLREGKIFAKFNQELKIYDLRDLDCKIGVDIHLLKKK